MEYVYGCWVWMGEGVGAGLLWYDACLVVLIFFSGLVPPPLRVHVSLRPSQLLFCRLSPRPRYLTNRQMLKKQNWLFRWPIHRNITAGMNPTPTAKEQCNEEKQLFHKQLFLKHFFFFLPCAHILLCWCILFIVVPCQKDRGKIINVLSIRWLTALNQMFKS